MYILYYIVCRPEGIACKMYLCTRIIDAEIVSDKNASKPHGF